MADKPVCKIEGCGKGGKLARGWCPGHYQRWQSHGDPLGGGTPRRASLGSPRRYFEEVVLAYEGDECLTWPYQTNTYGYGIIGNKPVHRRVCEEVNGPPPTGAHQAAHSCGKGHLACCAKRHVSWKTPSANQMDRIVHGTSNRGERNASAVLTQQDALQILALKGTKSQSKIASQFGVCTSTVGYIHAGVTWGWLGDPTCK